MAPPRSVAQGDVVVMCMQPAPSTTTLFLSEAIQSFQGASAVRQISGIALLLDESDSPQSLLRCEPSERQNRSDQQTRLPESQRRSPLLSRF